MILVVDSHALIHRSYHAYPPMHNSVGTPVNAVFGTFSLIIKEILNTKPEHIFIAEDLPSPTFRHLMQDDYKGTRDPSPDDLVSQIILAKKSLREAGFPVYASEGYEADDVIGTIVHENQDHRVVILSSDMDLLQLVSKRVYLKQPGTVGKFFQPEDVFKKWSVLPEQVPLYKALVGDASDNIKGIKGVGPKTAAVLIQEYGSLDNIYNNIDKITKEKKGLGKKLLEGKESGYQSEKLATIHLNAPIDFSLNAGKITVDFQKKLVNKLHHLEFNSLINKANSIKTFEDEGKTLF